MMSQWNPSGDMPQLSPPTYGGVIERPPSQWPTVIGIIALVLSILGLVCGCTGYFTPQLLEWANEQAERAGQVDPAMEAQVEVWRQFYVYFAALLTIGLLLAIWQLIAGIWLLRRRRAARPLFVGYAFASLIQSTLNIGLQIVITQAIAARLHEQGESQAVPGVWGGAAFGLCIAVIVGFGWPLFLLIWFMRQKIKDEVATWP